MSESTFTPLLKSEVAGAIAVNAFAILSTFALFTVACRVIWLAIRQRFSSSSSEPQEYVFFNTQLGYYAVCLLIANMFNNASGLINIRWTLDQGITEGTLCTLQAILMQIGNWATAYFTVTIAVHTFTSLVMQIRQSALVAGAAIAMGWISAGLIAAGPFFYPAPYKFGPAYGINGLSCGVSAIYLKAQFFFHLLPIFMASVLSAILYSLMFLVLRGTLNIKGGIKFTLDPHDRLGSGGVTESYHRFVARIARSMLWYPVAYIALLVPYSVMRLLVISGFTVGFEAIILAYACWFMLGVVNVLLLYNTFRVLGPVFDTPSQRESASSFGSGGKSEKEDPSRSNEKRSFEEKADQYSYPTPAYSSPPRSYKQLSPQSSVRSLLPVHQDRAASVQSFYSYPSSPSIGRAITPIDELQRSISPPQPAVQKFSPSTSRALTPLTEHIRQGSTDSLGLPAAPRGTRSPVLRQPSFEHVHSPSRSLNGNWSPVEHTIQRQPSAQTFGKRSPRNVHSTLNPDYDPTNWDSRYSTPQSSVGSYSGPLLSAVNPAFAAPGTPGSPSSPRTLPATPRHSRSFSAVPSIGPAPIGRQRAVLVARNGSVGNLSGHVRHVLRMKGADTISRAPRTLFKFNTPEEIKLFATGCDGDIGGTSTVNLGLEDSLEVNKLVGQQATGKFWGEMRLGVKSGLEGKLRGGYAGFRNKARPTLFGDITEDVSSHEYLALRVRIGGDPRTRTSFVRTNSGELSEDQIKMYREKIRSIGISLLGGNSGSAGHYELGIDSIRIVNEEDVIRTPPGETLPPLEHDAAEDDKSN
ncbi:hypothetical protein DXG03_005809 [Asterophora parasitica]|uniref:NADH:ubiquinone oxidoreductase intermediate-associated protein 30 domain-containing protein n=1 Tax=Asterophora parasitica TaxID=117018 RepID=A0A9P7G7X8_9AGAR|nr:hypothetical protein DXG03_005809 [Asterophora parasitica]